MNLQQKCCHVCNNNKKIHLFYVNLFNYPVKENHRLVYNLVLWMSLSFMIYLLSFFLFLAFGSVYTGCKKSGVLLWPSRSFCTLPLFFSRASDESFRYDFCVNFFSVALFIWACTSIDLVGSDLWFIWFQGWSGVTWRSVWDGWSLSPCQSVKQAAQPSRHSKE